MKKSLIVALASLALLASRPLVAQQAAAVLDASAKSMGIANLTSIEYKGSGYAYNFGQAVNVSSPWPQLILKNYVADINYAMQSMRQEMYRTQLDGTPAPGSGGHFVQVQLVSGNDAWNLADPPSPAAAPAPAGVVERQLDIWLTPAGFIKGAMANHASVRKQGGNQVVTFTTPGHNKFEGTIDAQNLVVKTETWMDNPVLGDMPVVTIFSDYASFGEVKFPKKIVQTEGGYPVLELTVTDVKPNQAVAMDVPANVRGAKTPPAKVDSQKIGDGIWYLTGTSHHSVLIEFADYVVVIEAPLDEERSKAVMAEVHRLVPNKPIKYLVNTHNHFDHTGGLRAYVAEGIPIITNVSNVAYYQKLFAMPHTLNPDALSQSPKHATIEAVHGKRVLSDGTQTVDLYVVPINGHNDAMIVAYVPKEKLLVEADAFTPGAPDAAPPPTPNPFTVALDEELRKLKLDVGPIAPLHGRMTSMAEMQKMLGKST